MKHNSMKFLLMFFKLFFINILYPFFFRLVRKIFSLLELSLKKIFLFYNGPTDNIKNDNLLRVESDFFGDERFAKEITNFEHFDLYIRPRRWFRPLKEFETIKTRKEIFRVLLRSENQKRLLRSSFFLLKTTDYLKITLPPLLAEQEQQHPNLFFVQLNTLLFKVFLLRRSFLLKLISKKWNFYILILFAKKLKSAFFFLFKTVFFKFESFRVYFLSGKILKKLINTSFFVILRFILDKIRDGLKIFFIFFLRLLVFCFVFPLFLISLFITLFFSFFFFFDSVFIKATPWIRKKYPDDLDEDLLDPPLEGLRENHTLGDINSELKAHGDINQFARSRKLFSSRSFVKDFFVNFFNLIKWYYLTFIKFLFSIRSDDESDDEEDDELDDMLALNLPLAEEDWWADLFVIIRRVCVVFYIPIGILIFYVFFNSFFTSVFSFFFFFLLLFLLYAYILRLRFLKFFKFFVLVFIGNFTIRTLTDDLNLNSTNIEDNIEKMDNYYTIRGQRRRIYYRRSLFLEDLRPFLKAIAEAERIFFAEWNLILPKKAWSFIQKFSFLIVKPSFEKFSLLFGHQIIHIFSIKKIIRIFNIDLIYKLRLLFKFFLSKTNFSYIFFLSLYIFKISLLIFSLVWAFIMIFFQFILLNFFTIMSKKVIDVLAKIWFFIRRIFYFLDINTLIYFLLFKFFLIYRIIRLNKIFRNFFRFRNQGFLRIIGIIYSIVSKDNVSNSYGTFLRKWYNRFLFKNSEFYGYKDKKNSSYVVLTFFRNMRKNKNFFKRRDKKSYFSDLYLLYKTRNNEKKEILKALLRNQIAQKKINETVKYFDWYFENFVFYKYKIYHQLSNFKSVTYSSLWDWVKNYKLNINSVKDLEDCVLSQLVYRNNIPRLESSKIEFFLRNLFLNQTLHYSVFINVLFFELFFIIFIVAFSFVKSVDLFLILFIIFFKFFFLVPFILLYYYQYRKYIYRQFYIGNLLLIFKPINITSVSLLKFCIPNFLNKFITLRIKCEHSFIKLNYLLMYKMTYIEIIKDFIRFFIILFVLIYIYLFFFFKLFNFFFFFTFFFFSIFVNGDRLLLIYFYSVKMFKEFSFNSQYNSLTDFFFNFFGVFNLANGVLEICFFFSIIFVYTIIFVFFFRYLYYLIFFFFIKNPSLMSFIGHWIFLNINPIFIIDAVLKKKFELRNLCEKSTSIFYNMNYLPKVNLVNLEKELKLIHVTKYLRFHLLKKKI